MISTLAWKEFREHLTVWVALAALAILLLISLTMIFAPNGVAAAPEPKLHMIALAALILTETYGLICGAMMIAGEKEARTQTFLDSLPASRTRIWITKVLMGGLFTLAQALVVTGVLVILGLTEVKTLPAGWQLALPLVGVEAFGYGLFGSVLGRSVLSAFGWGILPLTVSWMVGGEVYWPPTLLAIAVRSVLLLGLLSLASLTYCRPDFRRSLVGEGEYPARASLPGQQGWGPDGEPLAPRRRRGPAGSYSSESWRVLTWLALRQGWGRFLLLALAGWVTGHFLPDSALVTWPMATLLVGVAFGTGMFNGEQAGESYRFLGDQRLPPGQVWLAKATVWLGLAGVVIATLLWGALNQPVHSQHSASGAQSRWEFLGSSFLLRYLPKDVFLLLWPIYGFSIGQLLGLVSRKNAVALVLSVLVSVPALGIWIPSLVAGGLKLWQVLPFAAALLLATRMGIWAWAGNLLKNGGAAAGMVGCVGLGGLWIAGNLAYRAVEIPDVGEPLDVTRSAASLPSVEQIDAGVRTRRAVREYASLEHAARERFDRIDQAANPEPAEELSGAAAPGAAGIERPTPQGAIAQILEHGWPDTDADLASWWLDQICRGDWIGELREAAALPLGVVEDPRQVASIPASTCQPLAQVLTARALQVQARGDSAGALDHLLWVLALSRNLRHHTVAAYYQEGMAVETTALQGLDRWLERLAATNSGAEPPVQTSALAAQSKLLERALVQLNRHEEEMPPPTDPIVAEYPLLAQLLEDPVRWYYTVTGSSATAEVERDLIGLSFQTPWEKERARRFLHALTCSRLKEAQTPYWQLPLQARVGPRVGLPLADAAVSSCFIPDAKQRPFRPGQWEQLLADSGLFLRLFALSSRPDHQKQAFSLCRVRAARLKLALSLFQIHEQRPAPSLAHLVPRYLEDVPQDPFSGASFHYLVSTGQRIDWQRPPGFDGLPPGQSILWTVGPVGVAVSVRIHPPFRNQSGPESQFMAPEQVFLVPSWPQ